MPIRFANSEGLMLHGIWHEPVEDKRKNIAILLLSPGVKMRVAPHRLYNKMADRFVRLGYSVLRFDFSGLGDSEGDIEEELLADLYGSIQVGRYVDDTVCAMEWVSNHCSVNRFILAGLCGGAITGLLTGESDPRVEGLLSIGIPVILDGSNVDKTRYLTKGQINDLSDGYVRRVLNPVSWLRLLTFQSDYRVIFKVLKNKFRSKSAFTQADTGNKVEEDDNTNPLFAPAFFKMVESARKLLIIFSESDRLDYEYEEKFVRYYRDRLERSAQHFDVTTIPEANHILSMPVWQEQMLDLSEQWLNRHFNKDI